MNFKELYERLIESQQLELNFNSPTPSLANKVEQPERVFEKWMLSCASKRYTPNTLHKIRENILNMSHPQRRRIALNCFWYAIKRRLKDKGFNTTEKLENQGLPLYVAASEYDYIPGIKCRRWQNVKWN